MAFYHVAAAGGNASPAQLAMEIHNAMEPLLLSLCATAVLLIVGVVGWFCFKPLPRGFDPIMKQDGQQPQNGN